jgi:hypothetical protein
VALIDMESNPGRLRTLITDQAQALGVSLNQVDLDVFVLGNPREPNSRELERVLSKVVIPPKRFAWFEGLIEERQYGFVVVDTFLNLFPMKPGDELAVRGLTSGLRRLCRAPPYPMIAGTLHLRKQDRKATTPITLLEDPHGWIEEVLGTVAWSANSDVRLGLERQDEQIVFGGYRRSYGELPPRILEQRLAEVDGAPRPVLWDMAAPDDLAKLSLPATLSAGFSKLPINVVLTWAELLQRTGLSKSSAHRLIERAEGLSLLERDRTNKTFRRRA